MSSAWAALDSHFWVASGVLSSHATVKYQGRGFGGKVCSGSKVTSWDGIHDNDESSRSTAKKILVRGLTRYC